MANIDRSPPALYHGTDVWRFRVSPGYPSLARGAGARHPVSPTGSIGPIRRTRWPGRAFSARP